MPYKLPVAGGGAAIGGGAAYAITSELGLAVLVIIGTLIIIAGVNFLRLRWGERRLRRR